MGHLGQWSKGFGLNVSIRALTGVVLAQLPLLRDQI